MSLREHLLGQDAPLEPHEVAILVDWLQALRQDVEIFGATHEDEVRMASISDRIERERLGAGMPR